MGTANAYGDARRAATYATLEFAGTYHLAYRDLPALLAEHVTGRRALDFGCGTGRSTRFLRALGFTVRGVDIADDMLARARAADPGGDYRRVPDEDVPLGEDGGFDLVLSAFTFDNVPTPERKVLRFRRLRALLGPGGRIVNLVSAPEIYTHEWVSFSTRDYPENHRARAGDEVRIVITDTADPRPVTDILWPHASYLETYARAGLRVLRTHAPLATGREPWPWVNETRIAPWVLDVLARADGAPAGAAGA